MKNLGRLLTFVLLAATLGYPQSQINSFQILRLGKQSTAPANPPINASYVYFDGVNVVCVTSSGASCLASSGGSGTVTSVGLAGTANQITVTGSTPITGAGSWTLSLPSNLVLPSGTTATTQSASDNSTKVATTAYADAVGGSASCSTVTYSATPTFSGASKVTCFSITLTGDVTSSTFSNGVNGAIYTFIVIQDSTGGRAFVPPSQMKQYGTWMATASNRSVQQFVYDGTNLNAVYPWTPDTRPVTANALDDEFDGNVLNTGLWTWANQSTATATETSGSLTITGVASSAGTNVIYQTLPATPWGFTAKITAPVWVDYQSCGIVMRESSTGKYASWALMHDTAVAGASGLRTERYAAVTSNPSSGPVVNAGAGTGWGHVLYLRISDDGTTISYQASGDGLVFGTIGSEAKTAPFTTAPDGIGLGVGVISGATAPVCVVDWFRRTQ